MFVPSILAQPEFKLRFHRKIPFLKQPSLWAHSDTQWTLRRSRFNTSKCRKLVKKNSKLTVDVRWRMTVKLAYFWHIYSVEKKEIISKHPHRLRPVTCQTSLCRCLRERDNCQSIVLSIWNDVFKTESFVVLRPTPTGEAKNDFHCI